MMVIIDQVGSESVKCFFGRGFSRIGKSKAFFSQSPQSTRRKAGLNVKSFSHRVRRAHRERRVWKSKDFLAADFRGLNADWKVKSFFLTESAEHAEKGWFKRQKIFSQSTRSTRRKADWKVKVKSFFLTELTEKGWFKSQKHFSHRALRGYGERRVGKSKSKAYSPPDTEKN